MCSLVSSILSFIYQYFSILQFENKPIVFCPDYLYYRGTSYAVTDTTVTFSSNCVEVKGSTMNGNSETSCIRFGVEDIFQIQSHLSGRVSFIVIHFGASVIWCLQMSWGWKLSLLCFQFDVAVFKIHVNKRSTTQGENAHESSGMLTLMLFFLMYSFSVKLWLYLNSMLFLFWSFYVIMRKWGSVMGLFGLIFVSSPSFLPFALWFLSNEHKHRK